MKQFMIFCLVAMLWTGPVLAKENPAEIATAKKEAIAAAEQWLSLIDAGKYDASWDAASERFKSAVPKAKWPEMVGAVRPALGELVQRKVDDAKYQTTMPGAPDGEYVIINFKSSFKKKAMAIENVTPVKEQDGKWRVSGYFVL